MDQLTHRQRQVLEFVDSYIQRVGYAPRLIDVCQAFGFSSPHAARAILLHLERKGYVSRGFRQPRTLRVLRLPPQPATEAVA